MESNFSFLEHHPSSGFKSFFSFLAFPVSSGNFLEAYFFIFGFEKVTMVANG